MITIISFLKHIDTHCNTPFPKHPCPGNDDHTSFFVWIQIVCSWLWRYSFRISGSVFLCLYHFDYFGHTYRHALQNLCFKKNVSWKWWACLIFFVWIQIVFAWLWRYSFRIAGSVFLSLNHWLRRTHIPTRTANPPLTKTCPGIYDHASFCFCLDSNSMFLTLAL